MKFTPFQKLLLVSVFSFSFYAFAETSVPLVDQVKSSVNKEGVGVTKSFLEKYFPTVELQLDMFDYRKATSGILIVAPLSNPNDTKNTLFTQDSVYHNNNRTTVNLGLGYRRLEMDNKLLLGASGFYDYEFPYGNRRTSIGLEARTTVGELNFNQYWGASSWVNAANSYQEKSLGGTDIEVGIPLPYMNWAKVYGRGFIWYGVDGANDLKGTDVSLRAQVPFLPGLAIEGGRRTYTNDTRDENFLRISYNLMDMAKANPSAPWFTAKAYSLDSMENQRYNKVRRENMIMKQTRSTATTTPFSCASPTNGYICTGTSSGSGSIGSSIGWGLSGAGTLIWSPNNSVSNYNAAVTTCSTSTALGYAAGTWRLPTQPELSGLYNAGTGQLSAAGWELLLVPTWTSTLSLPPAPASLHFSFIFLTGGNPGIYGDDVNNYHVSCVHPST